MPKAKPDEPLAKLAMIKPDRTQSDRGQISTSCIITVRILDHAESGSVVFALSDR